jgi:hypothetical protein
VTFDVQVMEELHQVKQRRIHVRAYAEKQATEEA